MFVNQPSRVRPWAFAATALALAVGLWLFTPWPLVGTSILCIVAGSVAGWKLSGRARVVAVNAAGIGIVLLSAELLASSRFWAQRPRELVPVASLQRGVVPLLPSAGATAPLSPSPTRPPTDAWNETIDAAGLKVRSVGSMFVGPREQTHWLIPGAMVRVSKLHEDEVIFDVVYTISAQGFRVTPGAGNIGRAGTKGGTAGRVLFFGCSYTFGEGVEDDQTLPAQVQQQSQGRLRADNFGIPGAGAHEMLTILEEARERAVLGDDRPVLAVYTALGDHPLRGAGEAGSWQRGRPRYELQGGIATRAGTFGDALHPMLEAGEGGAVPARGCRSALLCSFAGSQGRSFAISPGHLYLWRAMLQRSREILRERYGVPLVTLVWHQGTGDPGALERALVADGIPVLSTSTLIAVGDPEHRFAFDEHPNPRAYSRVAAALLDRVRDGSLGVTLSLATHE